MKSLLPAAALLALLLAGAYRSSGQETPISRDPVRDAAAARVTLFSLPAGDTNFYFRADLPGDAFLTVRFNRLRYWQDGALPDIVAAAAAAYAGVKDSFASATSARRLAVHLPPSGYPVLASMAEWGANERTLVLKGTRSQPVRLAIDTLSVLKTLEPARAGTPLASQIQYTFLLKDLGEIEALAADTGLIGNVSRTFDSLVATARNRWKKPDASFHRLEAEYNVRNGIDRGPSLRANRDGSFLDYFEYNAEFGTAFIAGTPAGTVNLRLSYFNLPQKGLGSRWFIALSNSGLLLTSVAQDELILRQLSFLNIESGSLFSSGVGRIPVYRTSAGIGYRVASRNIGMYDLRYRLFFNFSVSKALTITPDLYFGPKTPSDEPGNVKFLFGLGLSLRMF